MQFDLIKARVVAFAYEAGTMIVLGILTTLSSADFAAIVQANFGDTVVGSLVLLTISGAVKHVRNLKVLKEHELGAMDGENSPPVLI